MSVPSFWAAFTSPDNPPNAAADVAVDGLTDAPAVDGAMPANAAPTVSAAALVERGTQAYLHVLFPFMGIVGMVRVFGLVRVVAICVICVRSISRGSARR